LLIGEDGTARRIGLQEKCRCVNDLHCLLNSVVVVWPGEHVGDHTVRSPVPHVRHSLQVKTARTGIELCEIVGQSVARFVLQTKNLDEHVAISYRPACEWWIYQYAVAHYVRRRFNHGGHHAAQRTSNKHYSGEIETLNYLFNVGGIVREAISAVGFAALSVTPKIERIEMKVRVKASGDCLPHAPVHADTMEKHERRAGAGQLGSVNDNVPGIDLVVSIRR
jgi:hypothetical protein